jgi:pilus assembly protein TadC
MAIAEEKDSQLSSRDKKVVRNLFGGIFVGFILGFIIGMIINPPFHGFWNVHPLSDDVRGLIFVKWVYYGIGGTVIGAFINLLITRKRIRT